MNSSFMPPAVTEIAQQYDNLYALSCLQASLLVLF